LPQKNNFIGDATLVRFACRYAMATIHPFFFSLLGALMWSRPAIAPGFSLRAPGRFEHQCPVAAVHGLGQTPRSAVSSLVHLQAMPCFERMLAWSIEWIEEAVAAGIFRPIPSLEALVRLHEENDDGPRFKSRSACDPHQPAVGSEPGLFNALRLIPEAGFSLANAF